jgi:hypothetical protein
VDLYRAGAAHDFVPVVRRGFGIAESVGAVLLIIGLGTAGDPGHRFNLAVAVGLEL